MKTTYRALCLVVAALFQWACISSNHAMAAFSEKLTCPGDELSFQRTPARSDDFAATEQPPPEVAADPRRLALWERNSSPTHRLAGYAQLTAFEISGCGEKRTFFCWNESRADDETPAVCAAADLEGPGATFAGLAVRRSLLSRLESTPSRRGASQYLGF